MQIIASLCPISSVRGEEPHPTSGNPVVQNTVYLKQQTFKYNPHSYGVSAMPKGWMAVGESVFNGTLLDTRQPSNLFNLAKYWGSDWRTIYFFPSKSKLESMESSATGDSS